MSDGANAVIAVIVVVLIGVVVARRAGWIGARANAKARAVAPINIVDSAELPTFNVIALGGQETGKTVLLASVGHRLATEISEGGFRLDADLEQSVHLTDLYAKLRDPSAGWPRGTHVGETRSFAFTCLGSAGGTEFPILKFNYLDYAGELVGGGPTSAAAAEQRELQQRDLEERINAAHAVFGIIDGQRMLSYLRRESEGLLYVETSIVPMIALMRKVKCPVHFLLTKWDLFDNSIVPAKPTEFDEDEMNENDRLAVVRDELLAQPPIRNLVDQRRRDKRVVRLIPVSAIGRQFATVDDAGHMLKRSNGRLRPLNVEIPLCAVLPDAFAQIEERLDAANEQQLQAERRARARLTAVEAASAVGKVLARPAGVALRLAADVALGRNAFSDRVADVFLDWVGGPFDEKMGRVNAVVSDADAQLNEQRLARNAVLREFDERLIALKRRLPACDLTDRRLW